MATYAFVNNAAYRIMKHLIPGTYTFLLPATKLVPKLVQNPKRKTTGIRVPRNAVCLSLLEALGNPIISTSAHIPSSDADDDEWLELEPLSRVELFDRMESLVDVIIDTGKEPGYQVSTILDLTEEQPTVIRQGLGWEEVEGWI